MRLSRTWPSPRQLAPCRFATPKLDVAARIHPERTNLYARGITAMVTTLVRAARAVGVPERNMRYEGLG